MTWWIALRLEFENTVSTRSVGTQTWKQLIGLFKAFRFVKEIFSQSPLYRQCRKHPKKYAGGETS